MTRACPHCSAATVDEGVRTSLGIDWFCSRCDAAGTLTPMPPRMVAGREVVVVVREVTVPGNPAMERPWAPAESMPYAERVRPFGTGG